MIRSTLGSQRRHYLLAFNAKAKARPNFGLRGVGYYTSETYHSVYTNLWSAVITGAPMCTIAILGYNGIFALLDDVAGGGPKELKPTDYGVNPYADKPWEFRFAIGDGFANGPPKYKKAEGATELH
jgi:hypothetical protein